MPKTKEHCSGLGVVSPSLLQTTGQYTLKGLQEEAVCGAGM